MAVKPPPSLAQLPPALLSLVMFAVGVLLTLILPGMLIGRAFLALVIGLTLILLIGFLVPQVAQRVERSSLLVHTGASFFFGLVSSIFLSLGNPIPWIGTWLVLCLCWTFLPSPSFHRSLEDNFSDLFN